MGKTSKTFKIGEYAKGGVITVEINDKLVTVIGKDWDFSTGSRKSSDQSNAKEFTRSTYDTSDTIGHEYRKLLDFLFDLTTSYYSDQIIEWIETKIKLHKGWF